MAATLDLETQARQVDAAVEAATSLGYVALVERPVFRPGRVEIGLYNADRQVGSLSIYPDGTVQAYELGVLLLEGGC